MTGANFLPVTSVLTGGLILLLVILSAMVTERRARLGGVEFGHADDARLRRRIRAHGNLVEIAPMIVLAIGLMEYAGALPTILWALAAVFFAGRVLHALRMYIGNPWIGLAPIITQHLICLYSGGWLIHRFLF